MVSRLFAFFLVLFCVCAPVMPVGAAAPLSFTDNTGRAVTIDDFKGKTVLLNVWATWCAPCVAEMPSLNRLQQKLGTDKFVVVAVSIDRDGATKVMDFYKKRDLNNLAIYTDPSMQIMRSLGVTSVPLSVVYDAKGNEITRLPGSIDWDESDMQNWLRQVMAKGSE